MFAERRLHPSPHHRFLLAGHSAHPSRHGAGHRPGQEAVHTAAYGDPTPGINFTYDGTGFPIQVSGNNYADDIGGYVGAYLTPAYGYGNFESVEWKVDGAVAYQTFDPNNGLIDTPLSTDIVHNAPNPQAGMPSDTLPWYWNDVSGTHTVTVIATYVSGLVAPALTLNVAVDTPTVTEFKRVFQPLVFRADKVPNGQGGTTDYVGFFQNTRNADNTGKDYGNVFTADVTTKNRGGYFAFLQLGQVNGQVVQHTDGLAVRQSPEGQWAFDSPRNPVDLEHAFMAVGTNDKTTGWVSQQFGANKQANLPQDGLTPAVTGTNGYPDLPANSSKFIQDSPQMKETVSHYSMGDNYLDKMSLDNTFMTYLMFRPDGKSDWYAIADMTWSIDGSATFKGPGDRSEAYYEDTANNWTVSGSGAGGVPSPTQQDAQNPQLGTVRNSTPKATAGWLQRIPFVPQTDSYMQETTSTWV